MSVESIQINIEKKEQEKANCLIALTQLRTEIINGIKSFISDEFKRFIERNVKENSENTKSLGSDKLREMKNDLNDLMANSGAIVEKIYSDDRIWIHVDYNMNPKGEKYSQGYDNAKTAEENVKKASQRILGYAGEILIRYKYVPAPKQPQPYAPHSHSEWMLNGNSEIIYGYYHNNLSDNIEGLIKRYSKSIKSLHDISEELLKLKESLSSQEALDLWDQV